MKSPTVGSWEANAATLRIYLQFSFAVEIAVKIITETSFFWVTYFILSIKYECIIAFSGVITFNRVVFRRGTAFAACEYLCFAWNSCFLRCLHHLELPHPILLFLQAHLVVLLLNNERALSYIWWIFFSQKAPFRSHHGLQQILQGVWNWLVKKILWKGNRLLSSN